MSDNQDSNGPKAFGALDRAQAVSRALTEAARRARFSSRARGSSQKSGFESRRGARLMRMVRRVLFVTLVVIPNIVSILYFGLLASDQYVSEAEFTVSSGVIPKMDALGSVTGLPPMQIVQDTQIVTKFIESRALVEILEKDVGLREVYGSHDIDWLARFNTSKPIEKFTEYWEKMAKTTISFPAGIVTLTIRAFSPEDAKRVAEAVISQCENLINSLNDRMRSDTVAAAQKDLMRAGERLKTARLELEGARNSEGLVDVRQSSSSLSRLLSDLESELGKAQTDYQTQLKYVTETAPQMRVAKTHIGALEAQIRELKAKITSQVQENVSSRAEKALSGKITEFSRLELEQQIAERRYAATASAVEAAQMLAERKMLYLHKVVAPALPHDPRYPKRALDIGLTLFGSLLLWATLAGVLSFVRNHMA